MTPADRTLLREAGPYRVLVRVNQKDLWTEFIVISSRENALAPGSIRLIIERLLNETARKPKKGKR